MVKRKKRKRKKKGKKSTKTKLAKKSSQKTTFPRQYSYVLLGGLNNAIQLLCGCLQ